MIETREVPFGRPWIGEEERDAVLRVLGGHILTHGPECKAFEAEFAAFAGGDGHAVSLSSCMAALHLALVHLGIGPGDEVILPALTHVAAAHAVEWVGATPVFVDPDPVSGNVTAERIEPAIGPRTKAISLVHFVGIPCEMDAIVELARRRDLKVVEDCAIALGARWRGRHVGLLGDVGTFSFYPVKHITTGEGGMLLTRHRAVADAISKLRAFGVDRTHSERSVPGLYEVPSLGLNYRMSEMQAAIGRAQVQRLDEILRRRRENFRALADGLAGAPGVRVLDSASAEAEQSHYCLVAVLDGALRARRNDVVARLNGAGIGTSVYYPQPIPRMQYYRAKYGYDATRFPVATQISDGSVALPVGPHLTVEDARHVAQVFRAVIKEVGT